MSFIKFILGDCLYSFCYRVIRINVKKSFYE